MKRCGFGPHGNFDGPEFGKASFEGRGLGLKKLVQL
jgi:hypothetical protein